MNKSQLIMQLHKLQDEEIIWLEIYNGTDGPCYSYLETIWEIQAEIKEVKKQLVAIWRQEKQLSRKAAA